MIAVRKRSKLVLALLAAICLDVVSVFAAVGTIKVAKMLVGAGVWELLCGIVFVALLGLGTLIVVGVSKIFSIVWISEAIGGKKNEVK